MKVALVHERLTEIAGSEHVVAELAREWPDAAVTIPIVDPRTEVSFRPQVRTGILSTGYRLVGYRSYAPLLPLVPAWFKRQDFGAADAVVISHHAFAVAAAHAAKDKPTIAYVHSPARWAWDPSLRVEEASSRAGLVSLDVLSRLAIAVERAAAPRLTAIAANSNAVKDRIRKFWDRDAHVIHPPVNVEYFTPDPGLAKEDFFLLPGRLVSYKRPDIAVKAAAAAGVQLVVAGEGRDGAKCRALAEGADITFLGRVSNDELRDLYRRAKAMIMPGEEDFGITPVEAMACGTPVIALGVGGVLDSVVDGVTGILVRGHGDAEVVANFADTFASFDGGRFDPGAISTHAQQFSPEQFRQRMAELVTQTANV